MLLLLLVVCSHPRMEHPAPTTRCLTAPKSSPALRKLLIWTQLPKELLIYPPKLLSHKATAADSPWILQPPPCCCAAP
jgi:hypothetical protein